MLFQIKTSEFRYVNDFCQFGQKEITYQLIVVVRAAENEESMREYAERQGTRNRYKV
jgi:hypothetical protein